MGKQKKKHKGPNCYLDEFDDKTTCERCEGIGLVADGQLTCPECHGGGCKMPDGAAICPECLGGGDKRPNG